MHALLVPIRDDDGNAAARHHDRGLRRQARARRRRQRPHRVRPRARPARRAARPLRGGARGRHLLQPDREPDQALLRDARHADPGPRERLRRVDQRDQGRARHRDPARPGAAPVRPARRDEEVLLLDYRTHQRRLLPALATTYGLHFAQQRLSPSCTRSSPPRSRATGSGASSRRSPRASRRSPPGTRPRRSRPAARRAAAPATCARTASPR